MIFFGLLIGLTGVFYLSKVWEFYIINFGPFSVSVSSVIWIIIAIISAILIIIFSLKFSPDVGFYVLIIIIGGTLMVIGYFLYEWLIYGPGSIWELPVNLGQVFIGLIISIPVSKSNSLSS